MPARVMAALAELRCLADQKLGMITAVRRVATQTIFCHRRMLEHERPSFLRVAFVAQFIDRIGFDLFVAKGSVGIVTAGTLDQTLFHRMMGLSA